MKPFSLLLASSLAVLLASSCAKQKEAEEAQTKTELLVSEKWIIYKVHQTVWVNDSLVFDETEELNSTAVFKTDKTVLITVPGEGSESFTWGLFNNQLSLGPDLYQIQTLSKTELILSKTETENDPDLGTVKTRNNLFFKH
ncbi:MAG: hypothetical protein ACPF9D_04450 [Owenweeksia sp.]